ncbi:tannase/feruloyl esterase family alpha/beta hydrolase [Hydrogenophaga sp. SL48]|uniref:tannase/feruloyl esterase family alpha/beta hydrolase n=1 Tax=Hydrogenophaga sp. SL48 TaxID=2806347 RepID=UPI001F257C26|nr:tannase/feruloyl esterase family alpha/beta hydrolase [Hydrogenophaga sp. SL48]UJW83056.1 tannase/feruloyl esterase family alpha/beta hydrolase [Hydrogenophaga sp. SL48]
MSMTLEFRIPFVFAISLVLAACASNTPVAPARSACAQLTTVRVPASAIGLPTQGATVTAATLVAASGAGSSAVVEHCLVTAAIKPVDPTAWDIRFQMALPTTWNSKTVTLGGGGYNGTIPSVTGNLGATSRAISTPLSRGYAVFGSDSGHQNETLPDQGAFAVNQEAYRNWQGDALKKTRDAAAVLIEATYGAKASRAYFLGSSTGGKEALTVAGRWPTDWDGVVSLYPARPVVSHILAFIRASQAFAAPGAFPNYAKRGVLRRAALEACDGLDGVADGVISYVQLCNARFDPMTASLAGVAVRCSGGTDTGDTCLSDVQIGAFVTMNSRLDFAFPLASGETSFPGWNAFFSDSGANEASLFNSGIAARAIGNAAPGYPATSAMSRGAGFADGFVRHAVTGDANYNYLTINATDPGAYAARFSAQSALDIGDRDLSGFAARGGKVLLMHGTEDLLISPRVTQLYYQGQQARLGAAAVDAFIRYYEAPGFGHGTGTSFQVSWDQLTALENWVERGTDPGVQTVTDVAGVPGRTRPLCLYPAFPRYKGSGDVNLAASYTCSL